MSLILFSFVLKTETQEAVFAGNIEPQTALPILQQLVIADLVKKAQIKPLEETEEAKPK